MSVSNPSSTSMKTTQNVAAELENTTYLAGWQVYNSNTNSYYSTIIAPNDLTMEKLYSYGNRTSYQVRPVIYPYASIIKFNNSYPNELAYTNGITNGQEIGVTMLDTVMVEGVQVNNSGYAVKAFSVNGYTDSAIHQANANSRASKANDFRTTANDSKKRKSYFDSFTGGSCSKKADKEVSVTTNEADASQIVIKPNREAIFIDMSYTVPQVTVQYNPAVLSTSAPSADSNEDYKDKGSVFYWNTADETKSSSGDYKTPMIIQPVEINKTIDISAIYSDSDTSSLSKYKTVWQDFTGDTNNNGDLTAAEQKALSKYNLDRNPSTGDVFSYNPKVTNSLIYYHFIERAKSRNSGNISGLVTLRDYPVFGNKDVTETPINGATVTVDGLTATTAYDADFGGIDGEGGNGYFSISDKTFVSGEMHRVNVVYGSLSTAATQSVNVAHTYVLDAYDTISVNTASRAKNGTAMKDSENILNDDANYTLTFATKSSNSALIATKATLKFYRKDGTYVTEKTYDSTGSNTGAFDCTFNPKTLSLPAGGKITVTFTDNAGTSYFEHDTGLILMQSLGAVSLISSFSGKAQPALQVIGTVSSAFNLGWDGNLDDTSGEIGDDGKYGNYSITNTTDKKVLNLALKFSKESDDDEDDENKAKDEVKKAAESGTAAEKQAAADKVNTKENETKSELAVGYNLNLSFGLTLTLAASNEEGHKGEWYFEEFMLVANAAGEVSAQKSFITPIGIPVIVGGKVGASGCAIVVVERRLGSAEYYMADLTSDSSGSVDLINAGQNKASDYFYVYGDFTIAPYIGISAGGGTGKYNVQLHGDANFTFNFNTKTKVNTGNVKFTCSLSIKILVFSKSWDLGSTDVSLFSADESTLYESLNEFEVSNREYLKNRSAWNANAGDMSLSTVSNLNEIKLLDGVNPNTDTKLLPLGDEKYIAVFIDDVPSRTASNSTAVYYTVYDGTSWSEPVIIEDDGTVDDSPAIYDLENGSIFITWSTSNTVFGDDPSMLDMLNSRNIHGVFFDKSTLTKSDIIEVTKDTDEDKYGDDDVQIAYDSDTQKMLIYYTKSEYSATDDDEGVYGDAVNPYSLITYRIYDTVNNEFVGYSAEEEAQIKADLKAQDTEDVDAAYEKYVTDYYEQRFLDLAPTVIVSETLDDNGYQTQEPTVSEYSGENDPLVVETAAISYNGLSLFAYVLDYDADKSTVNDRDVFLQIYNFEEDSITHTIMITSNDKEESRLQFERIGGDKGLTFLSYLSGGEIKMFDITDNLSNDNATKEAQTVDGTPYYYLVKTSNAGYIPERIAVRAEANGDYTGDLTITDYDIRSNDDCFYVMFTENVNKLKEGIEEGTEDAAKPENRVVETQIYMTRYDIESGDMTAPVKVTEDEGANYANVAFAVSDKGFTALATRSDSKVETYNGEQINTSDSDNSSLHAITFTPNASVSGENEYMDDVIADTNLSAGFDVYNGGIETIDGVTVSIKDGEDNSIAPNYGFDSDGEIALTSLTVKGGNSCPISFSVPVAADAASASFTAEIKDSSGNVLDTVTLSKSVERTLDVTSFNADISARGEITYSAALTNNELVESGNKTFKITCGDTVLYAEEISSIAPGDDIHLSGTFNVDYDKIFTSVTNSDGSVGADADLTATAGSVSLSDTVSLYATADQMARMNAVENVTFAAENSVEVAKNDVFALDAKITAGEYKGTYADNNEEEIAAQGVDLVYFSDNEDIAKVYAGGYIEGVSEGKTTVTALLMPEKNVSSSDGYEDNYPTMPNEAIKTYTFDVTVSAAIPSATPTARPHSSSGGGGSYRTATATPAPTTATTTEPTATSKPPASQQPAMENNGFKDVNADDWFKSSVDFVYENEIMNGVSDSEFAPNLDITRAMFVTILYRMSADEKPVSASGFSDVPADSYYADAVAWGLANGVVNGVSDTEFAPETIITREQMCTMLKRYADYKSLSLTDTDTTITFSDAGEISDYALSSVEVLTGAGIINGRDDGTFDPLNNASRAECAAVIMRFTNNIQGGENND